MEVEVQARSVVIKVFDKLGKERGRSEMLQVYSARF